MTQATNNQIPDEKVRAHIEFPSGRKALVFPRSKKTGLHKNWAAAERALSNYAKGLDYDTRGIMTGATTGEVRYMAL